MGAGINGPEDRRFAQPAIVGYIPPFSAGQRQRLETFTALVAAGA
ncbi:hypothetical protein [Streptomyces sp. NPDC048385]